MITQIPNKILIIGNGGAGKTTLAYKLKPFVKGPILHLDSIYWTKNYKHRDRETFFNDVTKVTAQPQWIIEGCPIPGLDFRCKHADCILFLNPPTRTCLFRAIKRSIINIFSNHDDQSGCPAIKFNLKTFKWILKYEKITKPKINKLILNQHSEKLLVIKNKKDIRLLVDRMKSLHLKTNPA